MCLVISNIDASFRQSIYRPHGATLVASSAAPVTVRSGAETRVETEGKQNAAELNCGDCGVHARMRIARA
jgi:hypothetical protein